MHGFRYFKKFDVCCTQDIMSSMKLLGLCDIDDDFAACILFLTFMVIWMSGFLVSHALDNSCVGRVQLGSRYGHKTYGAKACCKFA